MLWILWFGLIWRDLISERVNAFIHSFIHSTDYVAYYIKIPLCLSIYLHTCHYREVDVDVEIRKLNVSLPCRLNYFTRFIQKDFFSFSFSFLRSIHIYIHIHITSFPFPFPFPLTNHTSITVPLPPSPFFTSLLISTLALLLGWFLDSCFNGTYPLDMNSNMNSDSISNGKKWFVCVYVRNKEGRYPRTYLPLVEY